MYRCAIKRRYVWRHFVKRCYSSAIFNVIIRPSYDHDNGRKCEKTQRTWQTDVYTIFRLQNLEILKRFYEYFEHRKLRTLLKTKLGTTTRVHVHINVIFKK